MVIQGKVTPATLRDVLRAEVGPDDAASLRDALVCACDLLEKQDRRMLDLHRRLSNLEEFVKGMDEDFGELAARQTSGPGAWRGELRLVYVPFGADVKVTPRPTPQRSDTFVYWSTPEQDQEQGQAFVRDNPDPAAWAAALHGRVPTTTETYTTAHLLHEFPWIPELAADPVKSPLLKEFLRKVGDHLVAHGDTFQSFVAFYERDDVQSLLLQMGFEFHPDQAKADVAGF